jgi:hypothetical protein
MNLQTTAMACLKALTVPLRNGKCGCSSLDYERSGVSTPIQQRCLCGLPNSGSFRTVSENRERYNNDAVAYRSASGIFSQLGRLARR